MQHVPGRCNGCHLCCCRRGCALLVGVGGSGKQSLAKFAAFVADCDLRTVSMSAAYNLARFRDEVARAEGKEQGSISCAGGPAGRCLAHKLSAHPSCVCCCST